jgi:hypothetical protein
MDPDLPAPESVEDMKLYEAAIFQVSIEMQSFLGSALTAATSTNDVVCEWWYPSAHGMM